MNNLDKKSADVCCLSFLLAVFAYETYTLGDTYY